MYTDKHSRTLYFKLTGSYKYTYNIYDERNANKFIVNGKKKVSGNIILIRNESFIFLYFLSINCLFLRRTAILIMTKIYEKYFQIIINVQLFYSNISRCIFFGSNDTNYQQRKENQRNDNRWRCFRPVHAVAMPLVIISLKKICQIIKYFQYNNYR